MKKLLLGLLAVGAASAQQFSVLPFAGSFLPPTPSMAATSSIGNTNSVVRDAPGNIYFSTGECVYKVDTNGTLTVVAGNGISGYLGDGGPAVNAELSNAWGIAVDGSGSLYIADELNNRIRRVSPDGIITTVAGIGTMGFSGDGAAAVDAQLHYPLNVTLDASGNLYIADNFNNRIRKVSTVGIITTFAGGGATYPGDGGLATNAQLSGPTGMAIDAAGDLFIADRQGMRVRKVSPGGVISTVAGNGTAGFSGDGGMATDAELYLPSDVAVDAGGNLYIVDFNNNRIRKVSSAGIISTIPSSTAFNGPSGIAMDLAGNIYVADRFNNEIERIATSGMTTVIAGNGSVRFSGDSGSAANAMFNNLKGIAIDQLGDVFLADSFNGRVREISPAGTVTTFAGAGHAGVTLGNPSALAFDPSGNLFVADSGTQLVYRISPTGVTTVIAGNGVQGNSGDGGPALSAQLFNPSGVAADGAGNVYIISGNPSTMTTTSFNSVRRVSSDGTITTLIPGVMIPAGAPISGILFNPVSLAVDAFGDLFVNEVWAVPSQTNSVPVQTLKISPTGTTTLIASAAGAMGLDGSGNLYFLTSSTLQETTAGSTNALSLNGTVNPQAIAIAPNGSIYVAQQYSVVILKPSPGLPANTSVAVSSVVDAASESAGPVSPGKIVVLYGLGLGPAAGVSNQPVNGVFGTSLGGTTVTFNGTAAPILYTSATQVIAIVPYAVTGNTAQVVASYQGQTSVAFSVAVAATAPSIFTRNQTGSGQAAAVNDVDGTLNTAANPVKPGAYISLFATGEGQTNPGGVDGQVGGSMATHPSAAVTAMVGGLPAVVQYSGGVLGDVAGLMQVNVQIPAGVSPGGYVPVSLSVGGTASNSVTWIGVSGN